MKDGNWRTSIWNEGYWMQVVLYCKIHPDYRVNYQETFTLVAKLHTVRVLLSLAANQKWQLHKLDVKNSFLNGDLRPFSGTRPDRFSILARIIPFPGTRMDSTIFHPFNLRKNTLWFFDISSGSPTTWIRRPQTLLCNAFKMLKRQFGLGVQRIIKVLELAGGVMDELCNPSGPRKELLRSSSGLAKKGIP
uniref:Reverse transcriptase Ty1/copia-type domain-containing protein n=1 Tax=Vitis vinifera TaxID=29760 RepID=A5BBX4_VITVI|nr:hypothetical protein VITISV_021868 [Vitis vinifera]